LRFPSEIETPLIDQANSQKANPGVTESINNAHKKQAILFLKQQGYHVGVSREYRLKKYR